MFCFGGLFVFFGGEDVCNPKPRFLLILLVLFLGVFFIVSLTRGPFRDCIFF